MLNYPHFVLYTQTQTPYKPLPYQTHRQKLQTIQNTVLRAATYCIYDINKNLKSPLKKRILIDNSVLQLKVMYNSVVFKI